MKKETLTKNRSRWKCENTFLQPIFISYTLENFNRLLHENGEGSEIRVEEASGEEFDSEVFSWEVKES
jgi:hypothetical protein